MCTFFSLAKQMYWLMDASGHSGVPPIRSERWRPSSLGRHVLLQFKFAVKQHAHGKFLVRGSGKFGVISLSSRAGFKLRWHHVIREQLAAGQVAKENMSLLWFGISIGAATTVGAIAWLALKSVDWTLAARSVSTGVVAIATFIFVLLQNPAFIWRRSFSVLLWCLVGKSFLDTSISFEASQGFGSLQFELLPGGVPTDIAASIGTSIPIIFVMGMCIWKDHLENRR